MNINLQTKQEQSSEWHVNTDPFDGCGVGWGEGVRLPGTARRITASRTCRDRYPYPLHAAGTHIN